ncbi:CLUMA_CG013353, isoform B [Clunio marinus]|uniref:CLUMA_CG013353, isoform B n=1 Tax=Clunio marinus TaxID=568069 RepID=A0A1J1ILX4_9DIPT|nr:CLUMA_CG013353, isoform B [Clunio marinus]
MFCDSINDNKCDHKRITRKKLLIAFEYLTFPFIKFSDLSNKKIKLLCAYLFQTNTFYLDTTFAATTFS